MHQISVKHQRTVVSIRRHGLLILHITAGMNSVEEPDNCISELVTNLQKKPHFDINWNANQNSFNI